jgi:hypothetical protein
MLKKLKMHKNLYKKHSIMTLRYLLIILILGLALTNCTQDPGSEAKMTNVSTPDAKLIATVFDSGFEHAHDTYNGISSASDGKLYYVLCSQLMDVAGQMYSFDPKTGTTEHLGDLSEICGEKDMKVVAQGKSHVNFVESNGKLYFATHLGYYSIIDGMEKTGVPTGDFKAYRGGHLLSYDLKTKKFEDLGIGPNSEGIITMNMDTDRGLIYGLSWPTGILFRYDVATRKLQDLGPFTGLGEDGMGESFRVVCRSIAINPEDGTVYMTNAEGQIKCLKLGQDKVETIEGENMVKDYFGTYDIFTSGSMAYNWRQVFWYTPEKMVYGVHGNSGYLFRFDPTVPRIEVLDRLTSISSQLTGMGDQFSYGYLGFKLGPDGHTIYYLTGGPIYVDGKRVMGASSTAKGEAKGLENLHMITYDILTGKYLDHGVVFYPDGERPLYVNSIAIGDDGTVYTMGRITENGKTRTDLISIPAPIKY